VVGWEPLAEVGQVVVSIVVASVELAEEIVIDVEQQVEYWKSAEE
jgi:hypothetical protein